MNIAGVVVYTRPERAAAVTQNLTRTPGIEVHAAEHGCLVVTVEEQPDRALAATVMGLQEVEGVLSAALVYHHNENDHDVKTETLAGGATHEADQA